MRRRDAAFFALGGLVGAVLAVIVAVTAPFTGSLSASAIGPAALPQYYLINMADAQEWLISTFPDDAPALSAAFANTAVLTTTDDFAQSVRDTQADINLLVDRSFVALTGRLPETPLTDVEVTTLPEPLLQSLSDGDVSTCLGLDENPYNIDGYALLLYMEVPETQDEFLPASWQRLDEPQDDSLFWQRLACQSLTAQGSERTR